MENKNVVVALGLMLAVWIGFTLLHPPQKPAPSSSAPAVQAEPASPAASEEPKETTVAVRPQAVPGLSVEDMKTRELTVETESYRAVFSSSGARLISFELKNYGTTAALDSPPVSLVQKGPSRFATLGTVGSDGFDLGADAPYAVSVEGDSLRIGPGESQEVRFRTVTPSGLVMEKVLTFHGDRYDIDCRLQVTNSGDSTLRGGLELLLVSPWDESRGKDRYQFVGPATLAQDKVHTDKVSDLAKESRSYGEGIVWSGFVDKYFLSAAVPGEGAVDKVLVKKSDDAVVNVFSAPYRAVGPGKSFTLDYLLYFGPKDLDILKDIDHQLARAIDFGFFSPIARPLLHVLKFFYSFLGNYGLAIILLTTIIKALFWPLTQKSYGSMKAMQKLQPEMQRIREKYKNDRERLNRETMELYKTHRVNPLGGCLPMLVQIPVFFALYKVLLSSIELRHAPFALWLTDLSAKDPYYVTPLIMGATMFIQQKMSPSNMDPTQAKIFMIMPVVFTFLFLNFPSGLVIYWLVNNVLTIGQQYMINRKA